jgi:hypothetical protein
VAVDDGRFLADPARERSIDLRKELRKVHLPEPAVKGQRRVIVAD